MNCQTLIQRVTPRNGSIARVTVALKLALMAIVICAASTVIKAQDSAPAPGPTATATPTAEELRLQEENRLLALKKTNAELKKDIR